MKIFEPITIEIDGITWNIEVQEDANLPGEDHDVNAMYFKFASSNEEYFTYKFRFPKTLLTSDNYGKSKQRFDIGRDKAMILFKNKIYNDYVSTRHSGKWEDMDAERQLKKHSTFYKK